jgi:hypothetical protein
VLARTVTASAIATRVTTSAPDWRNADRRVVLAGGACEVFADCVHNIDGWIEFAAADWLDTAWDHGRSRSTKRTNKGRRVRGLALASPDTRVGEIDELTKNAADELIRSRRDGKPGGAVHTLGQLAEVIASSASVTASGSTSMWKCAPPRSR